MTATVQPVATRHRCTADRSVHFCTRGNGKPRRKRCAYCGAGLLVELGHWVCVEWHGDVSYRPEDGVSFHASQNQAQRAAEAEPERHLVARFLPEGASQ
jgi:hypothetical protein